MPKRKTDHTLDLIRRLDMVRPADLETHGIQRQALYDLVRAGEVERQARAP